MQDQTLNKIKLAAVLLAAVVPLSLATWFFNQAMQDPGGMFGTVNNGTLIQPPADITALDMRDADGELIFRSFEERVAELENDSDYEPGPWLMVITSAGDCAEACMDRVYYARQMHATLAEDAPRLRRYLLRVGDPGLSPERQRVFREEYPSMGLARGRPEVIESAMAEAGLELDFGSQPYVFLVDPVGNVMIMYDSGHGIEEIQEDIERLLEYSSLG